MSPGAEAILQIVLWGFIATLGMNGVIYFSQNLGWSRLNLPLLLGTFFTGDRNAANTLGFFLNLIVGWLGALFYYLIFDSMGQADWWSGTLVGLAHGVLVLVAVLPLLSYMHPRIASEYDGPDMTKRLEPPGFLALHYGRNTPAIALAAHAAYGVILGAGISV